MRFFRNSRQILSASWGVLKSEKKLIGFQALSAVVTITLIAVVGLAMWQFGAFEGLGEFVENENSTTFEASLDNPLVIATVFLGYLAVGIIGHTTQALIAVAALARFRGEKLTAGQVVSRTREAWKPILLFSLLSTTIGLVLRFLEERVPFAGKIAVWIVGAAWAIATVFAITVAVDKKEANPLKATKESARVLKNSFGENITVNVGLGIIGLLAVIAWVITNGALAIGISSVVGAGWAVAVVSGLVTLIGVVSILMTLTVLGGIVKAALYEYVQTGQEVEGFTKEIFKSVVTQKKARKIFAKA